MTQKSQETKNTTHNVSHDLKQEKFGVDNINHDMNKTKSGVYKIQIYVKKRIWRLYSVKMYVRKKWRLQRQNLRKRKKSAFTTSKFT